MNEGDVTEQVDLLAIAAHREAASAGVAGFFAAGEIGPVGGRNHVHGLTAAIVAFGSGAAADRGTRGNAANAAGTPGTAHGD